MKRVLVVCSLILSAATALAGDRYVARFSGSVPSTFAADAEAAGGSVVWIHPKSGLALVAGLDSTTSTSLAARSGASLEEDVTFQIDPVSEASEEVVELAAVASPATQYPSQWHLRAIGADVAWAAGFNGSPDITVAVVDTGIDDRHPDLAGRVDLSRSKSFVPEDDAFIAAQFPGRPNTSDLHYHGTHVASTIASNGVRVAGVTSKTTLLAIRVIGVTGQGSMGAVLGGILWAADQGAHVANMSLAGSFSKAASGRMVAAVNQAFTYAHRKGMVVVVASGNEGKNLDLDGNTFQFCDAPNAICVSATGPTGNFGANGPWISVDSMAAYSNFGASAVNVAAPGGTSFGPVWGACSQTTLGLRSCRTSARAYASIGTSMAAPHVSGLAALLAERYGRNPSRIKARIQQSADDLGVEGADPYYGKGRINIPRALGLQ